MDSHLHPLTAASFLLCLCSCSDRVIKDYSDLRAAKEDRLFEKGWLPSILPDRTCNIHVVSDVDRGTANGGFQIHPEDVSSFLDKLEPAEPPAGAQAHVHFGLFKGDHSVWTFAVDKPGGHVQFNMR